MAVGREAEERREAEGKAESGISLFEFKKRNGHFHAPPDTQDDGLMLP